VDEQKKITTINMDDYSLKPEYAQYEAKTHTLLVSPGSCGMVRGSGSGGDKRFFSSPKLPDRHWAPPSLLLSGYQRLFSPGIRRLGHDFNLSLPSSAKVKKQWRNASPPPACLNVVDREYVYYRVLLCCAVHTLYFFLSVSGIAAQRGLCPPRITRFLDHTQRRATFERTPLDV
jgi:hypothetical protein